MSRRLDLGRCRNIPKEQALASIVVDERLPPGGRATRQSGRRGGRWSAGGRTGPLEERVAADEGREPREAPPTTARTDGALPRGVDALVPAIIGQSPALRLMREQITTVPPF